MKNFILYLIKSAIISGLIVNISFTQNKAIEFDGINDLMIVPDSDSYLDSLSNQITLESWVNIDEWISQNPVIIDRSDLGGGRYMLGTDAGTHSIYININGIELWSLDSIPANTWTHIAGTYDGSELRIYINGELNNSLVQPTIINVTTSNLYFGNSAVGGSQFKGRIDEARIWNIARSKNLLRSTMYDTLSSDYYSTLDSGLVGYWRFDIFEDLGVNTECIDDIRDFSSMGNHGDTQGDPILVDWNRVTKLNMSFAINNGWNIVSFPGIHPNSMQVDTLYRFRDYTANLFSYNGSGYVSEDTLKNTSGYWLKHDGDHNYSWDGTVQEGILYPLLDYAWLNPFDGIAGWNLFGIYDYVIPAQNLTTNPPGLIQAAIYKYDNSYVTTDTLLPGIGYWIKLSESGQIIYPTRNATPKRTSEELINKSWAKIIIKDASGKQFVLYSSDEMGQLDKHSLPPKPPAGLFDVRFTSDRFVEDISIEQTIDISGAEYPLIIGVEGMDVKLSDAFTGKILNTEIRDGEEIIIVNNALTKLTIVTNGLLPLEYELEQNYPNPFNPSTTIKFSVPEATNVTLTIYNTLGQKVTELVNTKLEAGNYSYQWDAGNIVTGMYIYELRTDKFVSVKKMILLK